MKVAILVDGAFYRKRAAYLFGEKSAAARADELITYCSRHLQSDRGASERHDLYRIFYYDCPPSEKNVYHPLLKKSVDLKKNTIYQWSLDFYAELASKRKVALRKGELLESSAGYCLSVDALKKLCNGAITVADLTESDFYLDITQKGVDMRIGLDIASIAQKHQAEQIVLIAGDSDFVPAAKHARREGIDFVLDPMWHTIKPSLNEHIDGLKTRASKPPENVKDPLHVDYIPKIKTAAKRAKTP